MVKKYYCPKCGNVLSRKKGDVSQGYFAACLSCDEDFYRCETHSDADFAEKTKRKFNRTLPE